MKSFLAAFQLHPIMKAQTSAWSARRQNRWEPALAGGSLLLGFFHIWLGRYAMNPDGMSYLDVGQSFFRRDWAHATNAWWSPLYSWTVGFVVGIVNPSARWEFPVARLANAVIFILALAAFRFLLHGLIQFCGTQAEHLKESGLEVMPGWTVVILGYATFNWIALEVEPPWDMTPDLAVMACFCLAAGMLVRLQSSGNPWTFAGFGLILAVGYWTKAILFPLGFFTLAIAYWWKRSHQGWGRGVALAALVFIFTCAPLVILLSLQKGRFTFSDSGKFNYAWYVSPRTFWRNWQGDEAGSGTPVHPTRRLFLHPPVFEFDGPIPGTYPPWTDPSYWNDGLNWHFKLRPQREVLAGTVPSEIRLLTRARPELTTGVIALALLSGSMWIAGVRGLWPLFAMSAVGMGLYLPLVENDRYLGGFVLVFYLALLASLRLREPHRKSVACIAIAVFATMMLGTADYTVRVATHHLAIPGSGPNSTLPDLAVANELQRMGLRPGDKVAVIMNGTGAYWARLAKVRIVAEIMGTDRGATEFWNASQALKAQVYGVFAGTGARAVVADCPVAPDAYAEWKKITGTGNCVHRLE